LGKLELSSLPKLPEKTTKNSCGENPQRKKKKVRITKFKNLNFFSNHGVGRIITHRFTRKLSPKQI